MNFKQAPVKAGLSAVLLALAILLALQLPSSGFAGRESSTATASFSGGRLLVSVTFQNGSSFPAPLAGVRVGVSQPVIHGLHLVLPTNVSGEAGFTLPPGTYGVSVSNDKFGLSSDVPVSPGVLTWLHVSVNRTAYLASFVQAEDSTSQAEIEPWNTVVVEVTPYQFPGVVVYGQGGVVNVPTFAANLTIPEFKGPVFLQPVSFRNGTAELAGGSEVPVTVISQVARSGGAWLTVQPARLLQLAGSSYVQVVSYQAGSTVSFENG